MDAACSCAWEQSGCSVIEGGRRPVAAERRWAGATVVSALPHEPPWPGSSTSAWWRWRLRARRRPPLPPQRARRTGRWPRRRGWPLPARRRCPTARARTPGPVPAGGRHREHEGGVGDELVGRAEAGDRPQRQADHDARVQRATEPGRIRQHGQRAQQPRAPGRGDESGEQRRANDRAGRLRRHQQAHGASTAAKSRGVGGRPAPRGPRRSSPARRSRRARAAGRRCRPGGRPPPPSAAASPT